ncbi:hypothetical protein DH2020_013130 [Rehmannia glutinosa]|uniref:BSD domain-containing protein n=1 Tax=Rehmannia glutinosa TaxID=99300 RepID=A0ABR0X2S3_REHGL
MSGASYRTNNRENMKCCSDLQVVSKKEEAIDLANCLALRLSCNGFLAKSSDLRGGSGQEVAGTYAGTRLCQPLRRRIGGVQAFKELAAEASKMSKEFAAEAMKRADQITAQIPPAAVVLTNLVDSAQKGGNDPADLEKLGITDELREFVKGITTNTFRDFPLEDDSEVSDIPTVSNVRQDLTEWQERHAKLVLSSVKEISKLRYQLCPRVMKERKFWRIYFILVNSHVAPGERSAFYLRLCFSNLKLNMVLGEMLHMEVPLAPGDSKVKSIYNTITYKSYQIPERYEKRYMEDEKLKAAEKVKDTMEKDIPSGLRSDEADEISKPKNKNVKSAASEQDLDVFLLGDPEDSDDGADEGNDGFDDDFDKL